MKTGKSFRKKNLIKNPTPKQFIMLVQFRGVHEKPVKNKLTKNL